MLAAVVVLGACGANTDAELRSDGVRIEAPGNSDTSGSVTTSKAAAASAPSKVGDRKTPVPVGSEATFENGWKVKVLGVTPNATAAVRAKNQFNEAPPAGHQFYMVNVSATYTGQGSTEALGELSFSTLDSGNTAIDEGECGVIPTEFDSFKEVFAGGTLKGNICFAVPTATLDSLVLYVDAGMFNSQRVFFTLT